MRKSIFVILLLLFSAVSVSPVECAAVPDDVKNLPPLLRYQIGQVGDGEVLLILYGRNLPTPVVIPDEKTDDVKIVFKNSFNAIKEKVSQAPELPLITEVSFHQDGNDAVIFLQGEGTLGLKEIRGVGPANRYVVTLIAEDKMKRIQNERQLMEQRLPSVPTVQAFTSKTPVTLELRDVALSDVVRMLGGIVKKNIVIDKSMPNELATMSLSGVPFDEVVDYLRRMYDIDFAMMGQHTIIAGARDGLSKLSGREETRSFHIAYADVAKIPDLLSSVMELTDNEKKKVVPDDRLRRIYATASPERLEEMAVALQRLDAPGKQIMLHARVFEFNDDDALAVDIAINAIYNNWWFRFAEGVGAVGAAAANNLRPIVSIPTPVSPVTPVVNLIDSSTKMIDAAIAAAQLKSRGKVLANPSVITIDGQPANVNLTQEYPYRVTQNNGGTTTYTTERSSAGPQMTMTPKIGRDGVITIDLDLNASEFISFTPEGYPVKSSRQVKTNVRVRNGEPFVVGGLHREYTTKARSKIPILGDIPLIGFFFTRIANATSNTQVVMLVVPYILDTPDAAVETAPVPFRR